MKKAFVLLSLVIAMACIASSSFGQGRGHHYGQYKNQGNKHYKGHNKYQRHGNAYHYRHNQRYVAHRRPPGWAVHRRYSSMQPVYFPDYYTFYSPQRGGYYYWGGNSWIFSVAMPGFLANVNLGAARMQVMSGVPVNAVPYNYFNHYYAQYPPSASINIHIPLPPRPGR